jgi:hypothetical protein
MALFGNANSKEAEDKKRSNKLKIVGERYQKIFSLIIKHTASNMRNRNNYPKTDNP